jgi:transcriptional regulator with XRE-family HTH domain
MVDEWTPLIEACGGVGELADELGVTRRTLARWRSGATTIPRTRSAQVREMARRRGVSAPV